MKRLRKFFVQRKRLPPIEQAELSLILFGVLVVLQSIVLLVAVYLIEHLR